MAKERKPLSQVLGFMFIGYAVGRLTAPRSGKRTRAKIEESTSKSFNDIEKELKTIYSDTKGLLDNLAKDNPKLSVRLSEAKTAAQKSQTKVKDILSALHGEDNFDADLEDAIKSAKSSLKELKRYLAK